MIDKEDLMKYLFIGFIALSCITGYIALVFGSSNSKIYFLFIATAIFLYISYRFYIKKNYYKSQRYVHKNWGKEEKRKRNFENAKKLFLIKNKKDTQINDQTWSDLNVNDAFSKVDRTYSTPGEQYLYDILRNPILDENTLRKRNEYINFFQNNVEVREKVQVSAYNLWRERSGSDIVSFLWNDIKVNTNFKWICNLLFILNFVLITCAILCYNRVVPRSFGGYIFLLLVITIGISARIHGKDKGGIKSYVASASYLGTLFSAIRGITNINNPEIKEQMNIFNKNIDIINKISKNTSTFGRTEGIDFLGDYFNIIFLSEERSFFKIIDTINKNKEKLQQIYMTFGELEALISIASYREDIKDYVEPDITESKVGFLNAVDIRHPLIEKPVPNSIKIEKGGIIITGSNMSGKSTFLRTLSINMLFAETLCTCLAAEFSCSFFRIETSISPEDNILSGKSYYLGEAEAILSIIKACDKNMPLFCVIDEIFRGTNPIERISAASEIMDYLVKHNAVPIVATHDIQLTKMVNDYEPFYFSEDVNADGLKFDYHIKSGISPTRNAIKLLKYLGYPEEIIEKTNNKILQ